MIYTRPFITRHFVAYEGDSRISDVTLAVQVEDSFTRQPPQVGLNIKLKQLPTLRPLLGQSGFYCFEKRRIEIINGRPTTDQIPNGNYTLIVEPDLTSGNRYNLQPKVTGDPWTTTFERPIVLPMPDPHRPLEVVTLSPTPAYPFPPNATLVRGKVVQGAANVAEAVVSTNYQETDPNDSTQIVSRHVETTTDREGEFVLFFKSLPAKTQTVTIKAVKGGAPASITKLITE